MDPSPPGGSAHPPNVPVHPSPPTSGLAIASLVFAFFCQPVGLVLGILAMLKINGSQGRLGGMGVAVAGTVVSGALGVFLLLFLVPFAAAISIPLMMRSHVGANESNAMGSLKAISTGQVMFMSDGLVDQNGNGRGEFGFLSELGGAAPCRKSGTQVESEFYIPAVLGKVDAHGVAKKNGYCFKVYLPDGRGGAVEETDREVPRVGREGARMQERAFIVYAWPEEPGKTGLRMFAIDPQGMIFAKDCADEASAPSGSPAWNEAVEDADGNGEKEWGEPLGGTGWVPAG